MNKDEWEELKEMEDKLFKEMKNREFVPPCPGTGRSFKVRREHIEIFCKNKENHENIN